LGSSIYIDDIAFSEETLLLFLFRAHNFGAFRYLLVANVTSAIHPSHARYSQRFFNNSGHNWGHHWLRSWLRNLSVGRSDKRHQQYETKRSSFDHISFHHVS